MQIKPVLGRYAAMMTSIGAQSLGGAAGLIFCAGLTMANWSHDLSKKYGQPKPFELNLGAMLKRQAARFRDSRHIPH